MDEIDLYIQHKDLELEYEGGENTFRLPEGRFVSDEDDDPVFIFDIDKDKYDKLSKINAEFLRIKDERYKFEFLNLDKNQLEIKIIEFGEYTKGGTSVIDIDFVEDRSFLIKRQKKALESLKHATDPASVNKKDILFGDKIIPQATKTECSFENLNLNPEQKNAIQHAVGVKDMYLIWGPPGTGKSQIIPEIVSNYINNSSNKNTKILVCSYQNTAIDNVAQRLFKTFPDLITRFGSSTLGKKFKDIFFEEQVKKERLIIENKYDEKIGLIKEKIKKIEEEIKDRKEYTENLNKNIDELDKDEHNLRDKIKDIEAEKVDLQKNIELINKYLVKSKPKKGFGGFLENVLGTKSKEQMIKIKLHNKIYGGNLSELGLDEVKGLHKQLMDTQKDIEKIGNDLNVGLKSIAQQKEKIHLEINKKSGDVNILNNLTAGLNKLMNEQKGILDNIEKYILLRKQIILTTNLRLANKIFEDVHFDLVVMDESGAVDLPGAVIPILKGDKIVFLGDHKQLPPVVTGNNIQILEKFIDDHPELKTSVFEKLYKPYGDDRLIMLKKQYRMRKEIADFVSIFYKESGSLETPMTFNLVQGEGEDDVISDKYPFICFLRDFYSKYDKEVGSWYNISELRLIKKIIENFKNLYGDRILDKIAVITPYRLQNLKIKADIPDVECGTVHKFQGQEKEIIIYGTTRYRPGRYGFGPLLEDLNLLNVAISRAKEKFIIIGSKALFENVEIYRNLYSHIMENGYIVENPIKDYDIANQCPLCGKIISQGYEYCYQCVIIKRMQDMQDEIPRKMKTEDTHLVRSIHEMVIDDWLYHHNIKHEVEKKIPIKQLRYCDWYLPDYDLYIEYWGMMDDESYKKSREIKEKLYKENKLKLLGLEAKDVENLDEIIRFKLEQKGVKID